ncbi:uncharacterized protein [Typha angustifolia]|uniref:uncharacterized protein n=1 Tax=Typha angustifolia TaxID=59011 RepID=UPI003C30CD74
MKQVYDQRHQERSFSFGDWVYIKLQPYRQSSVKPIPNQKLALKFYGPYQMVERIGPIPYRLDLPEEARIHPVFHVSNLKARVPPTEPIKGALPEPMTTEVEESKSEPSTPILVRILARRRTRVQDEWTTKILVEWQGCLVEEATWVPEADFMDCYLELTP